MTAEVTYNLRADVNKCEQLNLDKKSVAFMSQVRMIRENSPTIATYQNAF